MNNIALIGYNNALVKNILELLSLRGYDKNNVKIYSNNIQKNTKVFFGDDNGMVVNKSAMLKILSLEKVLLRLGPIPEIDERGVSISLNFKLAILEKY